MQTESAAIITNSARDDVSAPSLRVCVCAACDLVIALRRDTLDLLITCQQVLLHKRSHAQKLIISATDNSTAGR